MPNGVDVAAFYFPNYHADTRNARFHGAGWTEWELVRRAEPRFPGHEQPKVPLWGYEDEADPSVMARKIGAAVDHGIDAFIFDWYWWEDGPFLHRGLEEGFLGATNNRRIKFACMWANHDWLDMHPATRDRNFAVLGRGVVSRQAFDVATQHVIARYFTHPSHWRVNGGQFFSIYELMTLVRGLGGVDATRAALDDFRDRADRAGVGPIHLNAVVWGVQVLPNEQAIREPSQLLAALGFDSVTSYVWVHHHRMRGFPQTPYSHIREQAIASWPGMATKFKLPYFPNVSMGWDASPRTIQSDRYDNIGYPFGPTLSGNTPDEFERALAAAREFLLAQPTDRRILTLNAWNEWTEGSYLEPDTRHGMAYLDAIARVFGPPQR